ncbi:hypothetical protein OF83DRAFT_1178766, partial [Amylostereum chailletii]
MPTTAELIFLTFNLQAFNPDRNAPFPWPRANAATVDRIRALELLYREHTWKVHGVNCRIYEWCWNHDHDRNRFEFSIHSPTWHTCSNTHLPPSIIRHNFPTVYNFAIPTPESTPPPVLHPTIKGKTLRHRHLEHKIRQAVKAGYLTQKLLGRRP